MSIATCRAAGLRAVPGSHRHGEFPKHFSAQALAGLQECAQLVGRHLVPVIARHCVETLEYAPVFMDDTSIEVKGRPCEGTTRDYNRKTQDWLHSAFVGSAWGSARLNECGTEGQGAWQERLETDVDPFRAQGTPVSLQPDNAHYCGALTGRCKERGWGSSIGVTDSRKKAPTLEPEGVRASCNGDQGTRPFSQLGRPTAWRRQAC